MENASAYKKVITVIALLVMVAVNMHANLVAINGITTGDIIYIYPSLITPADYTFLIWPVIYFLLFGYAVYQLERFRFIRKLETKIFDLIRVLFILSCLCNIIWIFAWHYRYIALSLMLIVVLLVCLRIINKYIYSEELSFSEKVFLRLPFSIYYGWITAIVVVNTAVLLISIGWSGFGISTRLWAIVAILIVLFIAFFNTLKNKSLAYAATVIWAYIGMIMKHISKSGYNREYPEVKIAIIICIICLLIEMGYVFIKEKSFHYYLERR